MKKTVILIFSVLYFIAIPVLSLHYGLLENFAIFSPNDGFAGKAFVTSAMWICFNGILGCIAYVFYIFGMFMIDEG